MNLQTMEKVASDRLLMEPKHSKKRPSSVIDSENVKARKERALKYMEYLLKVSQAYANMFRAKARGNLKNGGRGIADKNRYMPTFQDMAETSLLKVESREYEQLSTRQLLDGLKLFKGVLKDYQIDGVKWLLVLRKYGINGILADEMGLGKTVQIIALISYQIANNCKGPYLIVAPLSTLPNWQSEFKRFAPSIPVVTLHGNKKERFEIAASIKRGSFYMHNQKVNPVVLVSYQTPLTEAKFLESFEWQYIIVDEGQRLKNAESLLTKHLRRLHAFNRLLLTGTPLQNNLTELWALLNFLLPSIFTDMDAFAEIVAMEDVEDSLGLLESEKSGQFISRLHNVLKPFMLRRLKKDVLPDLVPKKEVEIYCMLTSKQKKLYSAILQHNKIIAIGKGDSSSLETDEEQPRRKRRKKGTSPVISTEDNFLSALKNGTVDFIPKVMSSSDGREYRTDWNFRNPLMLLRKAANHPYLIKFPIDPQSEEKTLLIDEELVRQSGKMQVLDAMLSKLKSQGHKVLIFSTFVCALDLIEELLMMRGYQYGRLDGNISLTNRSQQIDSFNKDKDVFAFLLSTRAGGLGLNLMAADTVIFYDRDWNPQVDIQAQARCHRIGQKKPVMVYTLITKNTIDERIMKCVDLKIKLEKIVVQDGKFKSVKHEDKSSLAEELKELERFLSSSNTSKDSKSFVYSDKELDVLLDRSELYKELLKRSEP